MSTGESAPVVGPRSPEYHEALVAVEDVTKQYGQRVAIDGLMLKLWPGQIYGLIGANGGGKTTTLRVLAGILRPDRGRGHVLGFELVSGAAAIRRHVGYMSQRFSLYPELSVFENLRFRAEVYGLGHPREAAEAAIENFELKAFAKTAAGALSGGWARRLQLAATLIHAPRLILLDEPTAGLDSVSRHGVWRRLGLLAAAGAGIIVSTHDLAEADRCSRASFISEGRVIAMGTPDEVASSAPAAAFVWSGTPSRLIAERIVGLRGVIATVPQGESLRIITDAHGQEHLRRLAFSAGANITSVPMRLEDAALVFSK